MERVRADYRALHVNPECSGQEKETAAWIFERLRQMGYAPLGVGQYGVCADLVTDAALPWLLLRADMDALPLSEKSAAPVKSAHPGVMHACGHDAHMAMLLAAAEGLRGQRLPRNIRFLFQPSEENTRGAQEMIEHQALPKGLIAAFALHVWPGIEKGRLAARAGAMMASSDEFRILFHGKSAHCAQRAQGADALQAALALAGRFPEMEKLGDEKTILFLGSLSGGTSHNIVAERAEMHGTLRTFSEDARARIRAALTEAGAQCAGERGAQVQTLYESGCPPVCNDPRVISQLKKLFPTLQTDAAPSLAAEDFSRYLAHAPGALIWLGTGMDIPLHQEAFFVPEEILPVGAAALIKIAQYEWKEGIDEWPE